MASAVAAVAMVMWTGRTPSHRRAQALRVREIGRFSQRETIPSVALTVRRSTVRVASASSSSRMKSPGSARTPVRADATSSRLVNGCGRPRRQASGRPSRCSMPSRSRSASRRSACALTRHRRDRTTRRLAPWLSRALRIASGSSQWTSSFRPARSRSSRTRRARLAGPTGAMKAASAPASAASIRILEMAGRPATRGSWLWAGSASTTTMKDEPAANA